MTEPVVCDPNAAATMPAATAAADPLEDPAFEAWAEALWRPILEYGVEERP